MIPLDTLTKIDACYACGRHCLAERAIGFSSAFKLYQCPRCTPREFDRLWADAVPFDPPKTVAPF